ncbi:MAG: DUF751 family protein [Prochloraceae cyanobacterium]|nr:DUF751 family protein [Prochloraceae cyanobacterium]
MEKQQDFWKNVSRYPGFLITISLGIFFALFERIKPLLQNPVTLIALIGLLLGTIAFIFFTLQAMLGLTSV